MHNMTPQTRMVDSKTCCAHHGDIFEKMGKVTMNAQHGVKMGLIYFNQITK